MKLPLEGLRILAVEQYGAGPYGSCHLADMGAEVIKIEHRASGGDMARGVGPYFLGPHDSEFFQTFNRNKRSLTLDLKHPKGREVFEKLVATADGVFGNMRGDQPEKLRLRYDDLKAINPRIVCAHLSAYGCDGSRRSWPGYDFLVQAECGFLSVTGEPDGPPARFGLSMVDYMTGMTAAFALMCGLHAARASGLGRDVEVSLYRRRDPPAELSGDLVSERGPGHDAAAALGPPLPRPLAALPDQDGWIFFMCQTQRFWELLCAKIGRPELIDEPAFRDQAARHANRDRLTEVLDQALAARTTAEWLDVLGGVVPCAPVYDVREALENPFLAERAGVQALDHPDRPGFRLLASPIRTGAEAPARPAPKLGQDTDALLEELGYGPAAIEELRAQGVI